MTDVHLVFYISIKNMYKNTHEYCTNEELSPLTYKFINISVHMYIKQHIKTLVHTLAII